MKKVPMHSRPANIRIAKVIRQTARRARIYQLSVFAINTSFHPSAKMPASLDISKKGWHRIWSSQWHFMATDKVYPNAALSQSYWPVSLLRLSKLAITRHWRDAMNGRYTRDIKIKYI